MNSIYTYKDFEQFNISPEDFKIDVYKINIFDLEFYGGVEIYMPNLNISVKCHNYRSQVKNKEKCLEMLYKILLNCSI